MPKDLKKQYSRENVDAYHKELLYFVDLVNHWPKDNFELQEYLDQDRDTAPIPDEFQDFQRDH